MHSVIPPVAKKDVLRELHVPDSSSFWQCALLFGLFLMFEGVIAHPQVRSSWWLLVPAWLVLGHLMHCHLIAFHESAHRTLMPNRLVNDMAGRFIGVLSFMSLTLYRVAHHLHHGYIGTERDVELWPFVIRSMPRWRRCVAAAIELTFGLFFTPFLFLRGYGTISRAGLNRRDRVHILVELVGITAFWVGVVTLATWIRCWPDVVVMYVVPAMIAGNMQSFRKYVEHMGMLGASPLGCTRTVVDQSWLGRALAFSMFNVSYHGLHHEYGAMPQDRIPVAFPLVFGDGEAVLPSYWSALREMVCHLSDPRVGRQWLDEAAVCASSNQTSSAA